MLGHVIQARRLGSPTDSVILEPVNWGKSRELKD